MGVEDYNGASPGEAVEVARTIAERDADFDELFVRIGAELSGREHEPASGDERKEKVLGRTAVLLAQIEDPSLSISGPERVEGAMSEKQYKALADRYSGLIDGADASELEDMFRTALHPMAEKIDEGLDTAGFSAEDRTEYFSKTLSAAREIADEEDCSVSKVCSEDELFYQVYRRAFTLDEFADNYIKVQEAMSTELVEVVANARLEQSMPAEFDDISEEEREAILRRWIQQNPTIKARLSKIAENLKEIRRQLFYIRVSKTWGDSAFNDLTQVQRDAMMPKRPLTQAAQAELEK